MLIGHETLHALFLDPAHNFLDSRFVDSVQELVVSGPQAVGSPVYFFTLGYFFESFNGYLVVPGQLRQQQKILLKSVAGLLRGNFDRSSVCQSQGDELIIGHLGGFLQLRGWGLAQSRCARAVGEQLLQ